MRRATSCALRKGVSIVWTVRLWMCELGGWKMERTAREGNRRRLLSLVLIPPQPVQRTYDNDRQSKHVRLSDARRRRAPPPDARSRSPYASHPSSLLSPR